MRNTNREFSPLPTARRVRPATRLWNPAADVYRAPDGWVVKVDLAGVCTDDLDIEISGTTLSIRGCRRDSVYREGFTYHQMEITYSRFEKTIQFPTAIEGATADHNFRDGFLIIHLQTE